MTEAHTTWLYRLRPIRTDMLAAGPTQTEAAIIEAHGAYLDKLAAQGIVRIAGRTVGTDPRSFGIVIIEVDSEQHAQLIVGEDPAVAEGVLAAELFPFSIAVTGD